MNPVLWDLLMEALEQDQNTPTAHRPCVGCWYREHKKPFPYTASSSLCATCAQTTVSARTSQQTFPVEWRGLP